MRAVKNHFYQKPHQNIISPYNSFPTVLLYFSCSTHMYICHKMWIIETCQCFCEYVPGHILRAICTTSNKFCWLKIQYFNTLCIALSTKNCIKATTMLFMLYDRGKNACFCYMPPNLKSQSICKHILVLFCCILCVIYDDWMFLLCFCNLH